MRLELIHGKLLELLYDLKNQPPSRDISIAITKMEEVIHRVVDKLESDKFKELKGS